MSFVYYSLTATEGLPLINAETIANGFWTTTQLLSKFITYCTSLDFADYDSRRLALEYINKLRIPRFFYTYSFDPFSYILLPPATQSRFPGFGTYVYLGAETWSTALQNLANPLSYRDLDGPITDSKTAYTAALAVIDSLYSSNTSFFDRISFETSNVLIWAIYPPINVVQLSAS